MTALDRLYRVIKKPIVTEKASDAMASRNAYTFSVPMDANKVEIRQAIERLFEVHVASVNTLRMRGKARRRGWVAGQRPDWKKAVVTLRQGDSIDIL